MYIKVTTTRTKSKIYRYVKLVKAQWSAGVTLEHVVATLGTVEDVLQSRDSIIRGLQGLSNETPKRSRAGARKKKQKIYIKKVPGTLIHGKGTEELIISNLKLPPFPKSTRPAFTKTTRQKRTSAPVGRPRARAAEVPQTKQRRQISPGRRMPGESRPYKSRTYGKSRRSAG